MRKFLIKPGFWLQYSKVKKHAKANTTDYGSPQLCLAGVCARWLPASYISTVLYQVREAALCRKGSAKNRKLKISSLSECAVLYSVLCTVLNEPYFCLDTVSWVVTHHIHVSCYVAMSRSDQIKSDRFACLQNNKTYWINPYKTRQVSMILCRQVKLIFFSLQHLLRWRHTLLYRQYVVCITVDVIQDWLNLQYHTEQYDAEYSPS